MASANNAKPRKLSSLLSLTFVSLSYFAALPTPSRGDGPYFVTYDHHMEEPGNLEIGVNSVQGKPHDGNAFLGAWTELEYGTKAWWTTEFYVEGQATQHESTIFTGFRLENRFRPLPGEHRINPILYVEYEDISANKTLQEVVGFDSQDDHAVPNAVARRDREREIEAKLILGSDFKGWNISENFIAEKNLTSAPWEFGYAVGVSRPLALAASPRRCNFCRENFRAGVEFYGGLGDWYRFMVRGTSQYLAPGLSWELANGTTLRVSPTFGLTPQSHGFLLRFGASHEIPRFDRQVRRWFR